MENKVIRKLPFFVITLKNILEVQEVIDLFEIYGVALIPLIVGLVELMKWFHLPTKAAPIASLILGIIAGTVYVYPNDIKAGILVGLVMGLSASGLYSSTKNTFEKDDM